MMRGGDGDGDRARRLLLTFMLTRARRAEDVCVLLNAMARSKMIWRRVIYGYVS